MLQTENRQKKQATIIILMKPEASVKVRFNCKTFVHIILHPICDCSAIWIRMIILIIQTCHQVTHVKYLFLCLTFYVVKIETKANGL